MVPKHGLRSSWVGTKRLEMVLDELKAIKRIVCAGQTEGMGFILYAECALGLHGSRSD